MIKLFKPLLAGATLRDRIVACCGGIVGICVTSWIAWLILDDASALPLIVAPMGASAVLVFAVPTSPLAQPWPVMGGNVISAAVGVVCAQFIVSPHWAAGCAVGLAILVMSLMRCLHPPGGAAALTAVIGGDVITSTGYAFALVPVGLNAACLVLIAMLYHRLSGHSYPHRPGQGACRTIPKRGLAPPHPEDLVAALADLGETYDIEVEDLELIIKRVDHHAAKRNVPSP